MVMHYKEGQSTRFGQQRRTRFGFEHLGNFEVEFDTTLSCLSGAQVESFEDRKPEPINHVRLSLYVQIDERCQSLKVDVGH